MRPLDAEGQGWRSQGEDLRFQSVFFSPNSGYLAATERREQGIRLTSWKLGDAGVLKPVVLSDRLDDVIASAATWMPDGASILISDIRAAICAPIMFDDRCLGAIYADYPGRCGLYRAADLDFLTAFASIAAIGARYREGSLSPIDRPCAPPRFRIRLTRSR